MPEVHGCGDAARSAARGAWLNGGGGAAALGGGNARKIKHAVLAHELEKKLDAAAGERAKKK